MRYAFGTLAAMAFLVAACEAAQSPDYDKRAPRFGSAMVTGGSVRGGGN